MKSLGGIRRHEVVAVAYFCSTAALALWRSIAPILLIAACGLPLALAGLYLLSANYGGPVSRVLREWTGLGLILLAYWQLQWFAGPYWPAWESRFQGWDVLLLSAMPAVPEGVAVAGANLVQASYALLYGMPAICLGAVYAAGQRAQAGRFLFTLFLGTFSAYALLPHFPVRAPRFAFPSQLTPGAITIFGTWNIWVLDHFDIATSVFPSGHVAVAFSSAFGLLRALPKRRAVWMAAFGVAGCVWAATIYSRFHYTADGAASFLISIAAWQVSDRWDGCGSDA